MKKLICISLISAAAACLLSSCAVVEVEDVSKKNNEIMGSEIVTSEPEYEWELKDYQVIPPENQEEYKPISDDAIAKHSDDIEGLDELIAGYETCYNYDIPYDESIIFSGNGNYYLITDESVISAFKAECQKYFAKGVYPTCVTEKDGKLYYKPVKHKISLTLDAGEDGDGLNYADDTCCELSYSSATGEYHYIEFTKNENGFIIASSFVE